jgi:chromosome segregation ATPase
MNITGLFKRDKSLNTAFDSLEAEVGEALQQDFSEAIASEGQAERQALPLAEVPEIFAEITEETHAPEPIEPGLTAFAQERLSSLSSFEAMYQTAGEDLRNISKALSNVNALHHLTREFLIGVQSTIHRVNDTEQVNQRLVAENNRLRRQADNVARLKSQHESLMEGTRRREAKVQQELERFRQSLADARLETVEARNGIAALESERADLMNALATRTTEAERLGRENEVLRERHVNQTADLDQTAKRVGDLQRRLDELGSVHQTESNNLSEARARLAMIESELARVQKHNDTLQIDLAENRASLKSLEHEMDEVTGRQAAERQVMANEIEVLKAKIAVLTAARSEAENEAGSLRNRLKDMETDLRIAEERAGKRRSAVDDHASEVEIMRSEIERLNEMVKRLSTYERFYRSVKSKQCDKARDEAGEIEGTALAEMEAELPSIEVGDEGEVLRPTGEA